MPCLDETGVAQFYQLVYLFLQLSWLYVLSVILFALFEDGILAVPNGTAADSDGGSGDNTTAAPVILTTAAAGNFTTPTTSNDTSGPGNEFNPYPFIPALVLGVVLPAVVTKIITVRSNMRLSQMATGRHIMYASFIVAVAMVELFLFLAALLPDTPFVLKTIPLVLILCAALLATLVVGGLYCKERDCGRGALLVNIAAVLGGIFIPQVYFVAMKLDGDIEWRWDVVLVPFWILDIVLVLGGATVSELHRRKLDNGNIAEGDGYFVALQFLCWIVIGPLIIFQVLLCVRENQLDPVLPDDPDGGDNWTTASPLPTATTAAATTATATTALGPNATAAYVLSGLELVSPILAGWCCALLVPVVHVCTRTHTAVRNCCDRLRRFDQQFLAHMLERTHRTVTSAATAAGAAGGEGGATAGGGSSGDCFGNNSDAEALEVGGAAGVGLGSVDLRFAGVDAAAAAAAAAIKPLDAGLREEWMLACARLRYAQSEADVLKAFEQLQVLTRRDDGAACTSDNKTLVLAVARELRAAQASVEAGGASNSNNNSGGGGGGGGSSGGGGRGGGDSSADGDADSSSDSQRSGAERGANMLDMLANSDSAWRTLVAANPYLLRALSNMSASAAISSSSSPRSSLSSVDSARSSAGNSGTTAGGGDAERRRRRGEPGRVAVWTPQAAVALQALLLSMLEFNQHVRTLARDVGGDETDGYLGNPAGREASSGAGASGPRGQ